MDLPLPRVARPPSPLRVAVDLSHLRPGGENGGIKPFLFETLRWLGRQTRTPLQFCYLTCAATHADVRDELARVEDELICVRDDARGEPLPHGDECAPREWSAIPPPPGLLWRLGAQVLYSPFGHAEFAAPGICTIGIIVDVLHRDFPWSLGDHHNAAREAVFQEIVAVADRLQCNSDHVISRLREHYGVPPERMFTVHNVVQQRFSAIFSPPGESPAHEPFFFYPANAWKHKNHETLLLAYGMYRAASPAPWPLVLTGHEDDRWNELRALARTLGVEGERGVRFAGYVPSAEFGRLWETAGALVFPSLHEGFGIPLLEAMEHDVPVLSSREGSLPEVGGDACLFVDARRPEALAEGMARIAGEPSLRQSLVERGRRRLQDFSQENEFGKLLDAIADLAHSRPPYRPYLRGIFPDGWTEASALLALPADSALARLTVRFNPLPAPRRVRLRAGASVALGSWQIEAHAPDQAFSVDFHPAGEPLWMEIPNACNLNAADPRVHGVRLKSVDLRLADGREYSLFAVTR